MKRKLSKLVYRINKWFRSFRSYHREMAINLDEDHQDYVRIKRSNNLPDSYDDKGIKRIKSWKSRTKNKHQYDDHKLSLEEQNYIYDEKSNKDHVLFLLSKLNDDEWFVIPGYLWEYYYAANKLVHDKVILGEYINNELIRIKKK